MLDLRTRADPVRHPLAQDRRRGLPDVELRIEVAAQAFDVEQRLLQQDQLRLDTHVEAACDVEQAQQDGAERDIFERPVEDGFEHGADGGLHLVDAGVGRYPTRLHMEFRHAAVIPVEHGEEVLGQVVLVADVERAHDAEVDGGIAGVRWIVDQHEDVAGVHVGVEEVVPEHLREEDLHTVRGEHRDVCALGSQGIHVADGHAADALHDHHIDAAEIPIHRRHMQQR